MDENEKALLRGLICKTYTTMFETYFAFVKLRSLFPSEEVFKAAFLSLIEIQTELRESLQSAKGVCSYRTAPSSKPFSSPAQYLDDFLSLLQDETETEKDC
ncbi:MAG: hypothetical protein JW902_03640 [Syntrophaceae bacterium]|nr:hypothetical protein [Syntrophaceae bacterium]